MNVSRTNEYSGTAYRDQERDAKHGFALLSHDLRASLGGVIGSLEVINSGIVNDEMQGHLSRARASAVMLKELLNLAFDMGEDMPTTEASYEMVSVADELEVIYDIWAPQFRTTDRYFSVIKPENIPLLETFDRVSVHRILNNLINNANKFTEVGGVTVTVSTEESDVLSINVSDTGPGFSAASLERLFEFRGRPENSEKPGSGLGLYIVNTLVKSMGGKISAHNIEGGASVTVTLPICEKATVASVAETANTLPDLSALNILLAEDNTTNQLVVTQMLKSMGARFTVAADGVEALTLFEKDDFDVALLDIEMPRKSGLEVLREIRARSDIKSAIPLLALTAYVLPEHRERIERAGADGIIAKPIEGIAALGNSILGYMTGFSDQMPSVQSVQGAQSFDLDISYVDSGILDALIAAIGPDTIAEFWEKITIDLKTMQTSLIEAEATADMAAIRAASHTLVSVAGAIGATNLQNCAGQLNKAAKSDDKNERQSLNILCIKGIFEILSFIEEKQR